MKKITALLLALCLLLPYVAFCEAAAAPSLHDYRYYFEHKLLPGELYGNAEQMLGFIRENGLYAMWRNFVTNNGGDPVYTEDQFRYTEQTLDDGTMLIRMDFPKPEDSPLCSRVYLLRNAETGEAGYFTVEYDNFMGEAWFLCGWTPKGDHKNFGGAEPLPAEDSADYQAALDRETDEVVRLFREGAVRDAAAE
jgi:hypothetical protein